ncbi:MAG: ribonuclease H-like domain-containing protein [Minisyncoccia bacterium]
MTPRIVVFDIETSNTFQDAGTTDPAKLDLALIGIYDSLTDSYDSFVQSELPRLWGILEHIDMLVGFNSEHFDLPLLNKYYPGDLTSIPHLDLLTEVHKTLGRRVRLQSLAEGTLKAKKGGSGLESITWWKNGEVEKVRKYCLKDVEITKKLFDYAMEHKSLKYSDFGRAREIALDTSAWLKTNNSAMTHTLPF